MRKQSRATGWIWVLLILAALSVTAIVVVGTLRARGETAISQWVVWVAVATLVVTLIGAIPGLWDRFVTAKAVPAERVRDTEDELAAVVLIQTQKTRSLLIGADEAGDRAANVRFIKGAGHFREVGGSKEGDLSSVLEYYQSLSPGRLVVLGDPGTGKTVLTMELLIRLLEQRKHDRSGPVPILISAAAYDPDFAWEDWLVRHLRLRFAIDKKVAEKLVRDGRILPMVDGVDEMDLADEPKRANTLIAALNSSIQFRERTAVVVTCRPSEYQALARPVDRATQVEMVQITGDQAAEYLRDQFLSQDEYQRWEPVLAELCANTDGLLASQLATPWRLTLSLVAYRDGGNPSDLLPAKPGLTGDAAADYVQQIDHLLLDRYVPSAVHLYGPYRDYTHQEVQKWLTSLADGLARQARHNGSATDIRLDQWWKASGRRLTLLVCGSLTTIPALPWLIAAVITHNAFFYTIGGCVLIIAAISTTSFTEEVFGTLGRLRIRELFTLDGLSSLWEGLQAGYFMGFYFAAILAITFWLATKKNPVGILFGVSSSSAVTVALGAALTNQAPQAIAPRDVIRASGRLGLVWGITGVLTLVLTLIYPVGIALAVYLAITFGVTFGVVFGANYWTRYNVGAIIAAKRQQGPPQFGAFLDWALQAGLLRISGVAYQFRHRQLQDWLVSKVKDQSESDSPGLPNIEA